MVRKCVVLILIDSLGYDLLKGNNTAFLQSFAKEGLLGRMNPLFAYRGIEATIFSGVWPSIHGVWTEYWINSDGSPFRWISPPLLDLLKPLDLISAPMFRYFWRSSISNLSQIMSNRSFFPGCQLIPVDELRFVDSPMKKYIFEEGSLGSTPTIFDFLRRKNFRFSYFSPPVANSDDEVFQKAIQSEAGSLDFCYIKFGRLDTLAHRLGPESKEVKQELKRIDQMVHFLIKNFSQKYNETYFCIISDHGMKKVIHYIDLEQRLKDLDIIPRKDFFYFLDSTMVRFWFRKRDIEKKISKALFDLEGHILSKLEKKKLHIDFPHTKYGELVWILPEGHVIFPDFWNTSPPKGMHGYATPQDSSLDPILILHGPDISSLDLGDNRIRFIDIMPTILKVMGLRLPALCQGHPLL